MVRTLDLDTLTLTAGKHAPDGEYCVMEAVAAVAGEPWTDHPLCAGPVLGAFCRPWNDNPEPYGAAIRERLKLYIPRLVNARGTDAQEHRRSYLALDWLIRTSSPAWLDAAKLTDHAATLRALPDQSSQSALKASAPDRAAARDAAWTAVGAAAGAAAAAGDAAGAKLAPVVNLLQASAWDLLDRMLAVTEQPS